jgi:hypothetical protein
MWRSKRARSCGVSLTIHPKWREYLVEQLKMSKNCRYQGRHLIRVLDKRGKHMIDRTVWRLNWFHFLTAFYEANPYHYYHTKRFDCSNKENIRAKPSHTEREREREEGGTKRQERSVGEGWWKTTSFVSGWTLNFVVLVYFLCTRLHFALLMKFLLLIKKSFWYFYLSFIIFNF